MSQQDMADFLYKQYYVNVSQFTLGRTLKRARWAKKVMQNIAKERNQDLQDDYIERRSYYKPKQMIFIDESGSDRGLVIQGRGYAPKGVTPVQTKRFYRGKRAQMQIRVVGWINEVQRLGLSQDGSSSKRDANSILNYGSL